jgi:hypothetical protein
MGCASPRGAVSSAEESNICTALDNIRAFLLVATVSHSQKESGREAADQYENDIIQCTSGRIFWISGRIAGGCAPTGRAWGRICCG